MDDDAALRIHEAVQESLEDGEALVSCVLVAEVSRPDGGRHLAHRATTVADDGMMSWTALGMLQAGVRVAEQQVAEATEAGE